MDAYEKKKLSDKVIWLAQYPNNEAKQFKRYVINDVKFRTKDSKATRKTQNSGVCVITEGGASYYGILIDIIELNYFDKYRYVLFKCQWIDVINGKGCKKNEFGIPLVNFSRLIHTGGQLIDEPYVLASQASQVFYVEDVRHKDWAVVVKTKPREVFEVGTYLENVPYNIITDDANDNHV